MNGKRVRVYLLDVEGTVAPISLVQEQLFPYARTNFSAFLQANAGDPGVAADLVLLEEENKVESDLGRPEFASARGWKEAMNYLLWLMDRDRKSTALKSLQGKIWKAGFESGELKGTLFDDVPSAFSRWALKGQVGIYSSGSVAAQRLLFRHSVFGDLTPLIAGYFDTRTGAKGEAASYAAIAAIMGAVPGELVFFSDAVKELDAAREAGCRTRLVVRAGNEPIEDARGHRPIHSFKGI
jgi:enolase-phosphatase E1